MKLIMFKGFPGSGKSTLSRAVSKELRWPLIDKDDVKDLLDVHDSDAGGRAYRVMLNIVRRQILQGLDVICDSPMTHQVTYERVQIIADESQASLAIVECFCSDDLLWSQRINKRKAYGLPEHHVIDWNVLEAYRYEQRFESRFEITHPHLIVDTVRPIEECVAEITKWVEHLPSHKLIEENVHVQNTDFVTQV